MAINFPGSLSRAEIASGLLIRSIKINGAYLLCDEINFNQTQDIEMISDLVQGGPGSAIANIGAKKYSGSITFPLRVVADGSIELAARNLINHAQNPVSALRIDSNHIISHYDLTAENDPTDNNELLSLDSVAVRSLRITGSSSNDIKVSVDFEGMVDIRTGSDTAVSLTQKLGRALTWGDCNLFRSESSMRTVSNFEFSISNEIETPVFIMPYAGASTGRTDQISLIGIKSIKWEGNVDEVIRKGSDHYSHIHGGWIVNDNLTIQIAGLSAEFKVPLYNTAEIPLSSNYIVRKTSWTGMMKPNRPLSANGLITFT